jgi:hypothetical protein
VAFAVVTTLLCGNALFANPGKGNGNGKENGNGSGKENASENGNGNGNGNGKAVGQAADFVPPGHRRAPVEFVVKAAPPAPRVEVVSVRPSALHVWVPGYWTWEASSYVWTASVWMLPPEPAAVWVQPRFEQRTGISVFISGYWRL